ncbi:MAG: sulfite exporter TauE/SafE family protein, partial [Candidatus Eiseniibacteriota bacterium]
MHHMLPPSGDLSLLFVAALVGGVHCAGMCGPYVSMCSARLAHALPQSATLVWLRVLFNLGRVGTYVVLGTLAGAFGGIAGALASVQGVPGVVSIAAGVFALLAALSLAGVLPALESAAAALGLDRVIRAGSVRAAQAPRVVSAISLGALQGLLPCALVYGAASRAAASGSAGRGALTMLVFGLGTLPALLALTFAGAALP